MVQGIVSGVTVMIGYGIGAGRPALWRYLGIPGAARAAPDGSLVAMLRRGRAVGAVLNGWRLVGWQNEIRDDVRDAAHLTDRSGRSSWP